MKILLFAFTVCMGMAAHSLAHAQTVGATLITSPAPLLQDDPRPRVFVAGSINMGATPNWQTEFADALSDMDVVLLNPRRSDWDSTWRTEADEPEFRRQVEWELSALESADVIVMYLDPASQSPISLLEFGLYARSGRLIVLCPPGFWRKGNIDITSEFYGVEQVDSFDALVAAARRALLSGR
ncbi:nucleoside 2-deoxyribosyltransferase domain-containing protein [Brevundimonas aveniformis]|uniref:nucleoside 2-deoxyribosyltransferase domain-containing protein n=1 Tax=Brevundimonas aveniformis TaxID=370977 RepID=UPI002490F1F1|nr:nucleoside 2-deoxyribosyltransferase domain-containing protein [Brevundimonas aveniformis]